MNDKRPAALLPTPRTVSPCCRFPVRIECPNRKEGTQFYVCTRCERPCDPIEEQPTPRTDEAASYAKGYGSPGMVDADFARQLERELIREKELKQAVYDAGKVEADQLRHSLAKAEAVMPPPLPVDVAETEERLKHTRKFLQMLHILPEEIVPITDAIGLIERLALSDQLLAVMVKAEKESGNIAAVYAGQIATLETALAASEAEVGRLTTLNTELVVKNNQLATRSGESAGLLAIWHGKLNYVDAILQTVQLNGGDANRVNITGARQAIIELRQAITNPKSK